MGFGNMIKNVAAAIGKCGIEIFKEVKAFSTPFFKRLVGILLSSDPLKVFTFGISAISLIGLAWIFLKKRFGKKRDKLKDKSVHEVVTAGNRRHASKEEKEAHDKVKEAVKESINIEQGLKPRKKKLKKRDRYIQECYLNMMEDTIGYEDEVLVLDEISRRNLAIKERLEELKGISAEELQRRLKRNARAVRKYREMQAAGMV